MTTLEQVAEITGGGTPPRAESRYFGGGIHWATPTDVTALDDLYIDRTKETLTSEGLAGSSARLLPPGAVLLTSRATIGYTAVSRVPISTNQGFVNFVCGPELQPEYLAYWLRAKKPTLERLANGATFKEISRGTVRKLEISLPDRTEQERVVGLIARAESIVRMRREAEAKAKEIIPALFVDMFGDPATNPKGWGRVTLGAVILAAQDGPHVSPKYAETGIPFLSTRHIKPGSVTFEDLKFLSREDAEQQWKKCKPRRGDVLYTKGGTTGLAAAIDFDEDIAVWVHVALLKTNQDVADPTWLEWMLNSEYCYAQSQELTHGIANRDLGLKRMIKIGMYLPPKALQTRFATHVSGLKELRSAQARALIVAQAGFQSLLAGVLKQ